MSTPLACIACSLDPQTTSLILPLAQATIIAAPVILRTELRKGVQAVRARRARRRGAESLAPSALPAAADPCREVDLDR
jgi:hypothetical protein